MQRVAILNLDQPGNPNITAGYCASFACRFRGLMFRPSIALNEGLLLVQPNSSVIDTAIHMLFMRFDITAVWIDDQKRVVDVKLARRWRLAYIPKQPARYVLETHANRFKDYRVGDQLMFELC
jgi:uncharacterized membrane protein (UPF0127 family)